MICSIYNATGCAEERKQNVVPYNRLGLDIWEKNYRKIMCRDCYMEKFVKLKEIRTCCQRMVEVKNIQGKNQGLAAERGFVEAVN